MTNILDNYVDLIFLKRFFLVFLPLYFFPVFYMGVISPGGGVYSPFLADYLNFIDWITKSLLYTSNAFDQFLGLPSYVRIITTANGLIYQIKIDHGASVTVWKECLGLGITSFWIAYVAANKGGWQKKALWCFGGILTIWLINNLRIALLLFALQKKWEVNRFVEHHTMFNIIAYAIIFLLVYFFQKEYQKFSLDANGKFARA